MKTETQLRDQLLWDQAEASLAESLSHITDFGLLLFADELGRSKNELAPLAMFAVMFEKHRREQSE